MKFQKELRKGYRSIFVFKCKMCNIEISINSDKVNNTEYLEINKAVVNASLAIGIGTYVIFSV